MVLPFWYQLTQVAVEKRPLNGYSVVIIFVNYKKVNENVLFIMID